MDMSLTAATLPVGPPRAAWQRDDRHALLLAVLMGVLIVLMIVPEGLDYGSLSTNRAPDSGGFVSRALWFGVLALSAVVVWSRAGLAWLLVRTVSPFLLLFLLLAIASVGWSIDPALSLRRLLRLATIVLACVAFTLMAWHARRFQNVVRPVLTGVLLASLAFGLVFPELAIHHAAAAELSGAWRGLANHKNGFGALACLGLVFWFHAGLTGEAGKPAAVAGITLSVLCLALSHSSTSAAAAVFVVVFLLVALRPPGALRRFVPWLVGLLVALLLVYALTILDLIPGRSELLAPIAALSEKDATLTGRTGIWAVLSEHISRRPLLGTGYAAYWTAGPVRGTESYEFVWRLNGFYPGSAHNGYLAVVNDLGWVGLACLLGYLVSHVRQALRLLPADRNLAVLVLAVFFQQAVSNVSETHWFSVLSVDFVLMTLASTALARALLEGRLRSAFGDPQHRARHDADRLDRPTR